MYDELAFKEYSLIVLVYHPSLFESGGNSTSLVVGAILYELISDLSSLEVGSNLIVSSHGPPLHVT